jgi:outer membrane protein TolC
MFSQDKQLTLEDAIKIAQDSSLQSFKSKNYFLASNWEYNMYKAKRKPTLSLASTPAQYNRSLVQRYNSVTNVDEFRTQQSLSTDLGLSLSQNVGLTGGNIYLKSSFSRLQNFGDNKQKQFSSIPIQIGYTQQLFGFNSLKWDKKIEPLKFEKAQKELINELEIINQTTTNLFFNYLSAKLKLDMAETNRSNADTLLHIGEKRFDIFSISQADLFTLKVQLLDAINNQNNAEKELQKAKYALASYLRLKNDSTYDLIVPEMPPIVKVNTDEAMEQAYQNSPDLLEQEQLVLEAKRNTEQARIQKRFNSSLSASYGLNQLSNSFSGAYVDPLNQQQFVVTLSIPLIDWGVAKGNYNMAKRNYEAVKISAEQVRSDFNQTVYIAVSDFNLQSQIVKTAFEKKNYAEKAYLTVKQKFVSGTEDVNSLILSLSRQDNAKLDYINAIYNYWYYYFSLRKITLYDFVNKKPLSQDIDALINEVK